PGRVAASPLECTGITPAAWAVAGPGRSGPTNQRSIAGAGWDLGAAGHEAVPRASPATVPPAAVHRHRRPYEWVASLRCAPCQTGRSLQVRPSLYRAPALPARNGMLALPGLPALAAMSRAGHARRERADEPARR